MRRTKESRGRAGRAVGAGKTRFAKMAEKAPWVLVLLLIGASSAILGAESKVATAPATRGSAATNLPPAREIIARFVKELGGKSAVDKLESQHAKGRIEMQGQGVTGDLEVFAKRPDKLVMKITLPGIGELLEGFDGQVGWSMNPMTGPMILDGKMLEQIREQARFDSMLHEASQFKSMATTGRVTFEGRECYEVKLVRASGQEVTEDFDVQTGLLLGTTEVQESPLGPVKTTGVMSDYKKFGDVLFATKLTQKVGPLAQVMTFSTIEFNHVDDSAFALPEQIKTLAKAKPEAAKEQ